MVRFYSGEISEQELLKQAEPFHGPSSVAYYVIAMKAMLDNNNEKAKEFFEKTIKTGTVTFWSYHSAKVWIRRLEGENAGQLAVPSERRGI